MEIALLNYTPTKGWSPSEFPRWDSHRTAVFVFAAKEYLTQPEPLASLNKLFPASHLVGCSTAGEIHGNRVSDGSLSVAIVRFAHTDLQVESARIESAEDSYKTGVSLATRLKKDGLCGVILFADGMKNNGSRLAEGFTEVLGTLIPVTGGLAGDGPRFQDTWVLRDGMPEPGIVSAMGFYGKKLRFGHGSRGGWDIFGPERKITRSKDNILYELDGQPALEIYKNYLGEKAAELPASALLFPIQVRLSSNADKRLVRTILSVDEAQGSMNFAGNMPEGGLAQLMRANFDRLVEGAHGAASSILKRALDPAAPTLAIAISCVGRKLVLGERIEEEVEATLEALPKGTLQTGFYSYGEMSPLVSGEPCELHNQTMTLTTLQEEP